MIHSSVKKALNPTNRIFSLQINKIPLTTRRFAAWAIEVSLIATSALVPYHIGVIAQSKIESEPVPLNPVLANTQAAIAKTLALPLRERNPQVPPLTNLLWCVAIVAPIGLTGWQIYLLGKTGQTLPKRWLKVRVSIKKGESPGLVRAFVREGIGRWGCPTGIAYLLWRYSGAFPSVGIFLGLTGVMVLAEAAYACLNRQRQTLHDRLAGTIVRSNSPKIIIRPISHQDSNGAHVRLPQQPLRLDLQQGNWADSEAELADAQPQETITTVILTTLPGWRVNLWQWMRQNPGTTLLVVALASMASVLGTFAATQVYIQSQANRRVFKQQDNEVFLDLVKQLKATSTDAVEARRAALLALARQEDPRAVPFLVDWLGQEKTPELFDTIEQSLVSNGPKALLDLQRLNQSLRNDIEELRRRSAAASEQNLINLRLRASQRAIAKILTVYSGKIHNADLSRINLATSKQRQPGFTLVLDNLDLSGINFKGAILTNASLRSTRFYGAGDDGRLDTFDDWIADFSGAELKQANLTNADLSHVNFIRTNMMRTILNNANLQTANLTGANLSSTQLAAADLRAAILTNASLTGADLANANFSQSNLQNAQLGQVNAIQAQFQLANLSESNWQDADLTGANFYRANLQNANLSSTKLIDTNFKGAQLQNANLQNADLSRADLQGANLDGANFQGVSFMTVPVTNPNQFIQILPPSASFARVRGVNFANVKNLDTKQITFICSQGGLYPRCR